MLPAVFTSQFDQEIVLASLRPETKFNGIDRAAAIPATDLLEFGGCKFGFIGIGQEEHDIRLQP